MRGTRRLFLQAGAAAAVLPSTGGDLTDRARDGQDASAAEAPHMARSIGVDAGGRMTLPVQIDGAGPFAFVVDCAAEISVISGQLADRLGLPDAGEITMHSLAGAERVGTVRAASLVAGALHEDGVRLIRGSASALGDVDGLLGADVLQGHRLVFRFGARPSITIERARREWIWPLSGRRRISFQSPTSRAQGGLLTLRARVGQTETAVILDSGAVTSVVNLALIASSGATRLPDALLRQANILSPTGLPIRVAPYLLPELAFGGVTLRNMPVFGADLHTFGVLGLADQPAILLAMDALSRFRLVVVDTLRNELILQR